MVSMTSFGRMIRVDPLEPTLTKARKTKIVCTVGPATWHEDGIRKLLSAGMNVMRINCSHGDHAQYERTIELLRRSLEAKDSKEHLMNGAQVSCAIALDTKGPEIRLGDFSGSASQQGITVEPGDEIRLHVNEAMRGAQDASNWFVDYAELRAALSLGSKVFVDDGLLSLEVTGFEEDDAGADVLVCVAENQAQVSSRKGVNLPGAVLELPAVSEKDREDLHFAREHKLDFIFASFIRRAEHIREIRSIVGPETRIIAKVENAEGINNIDEIIAESDGVMVARGDLGIEIPQENVFLAQKLIVSKAHMGGKPVICATQMLDSMTRSPRPTRAECADVANAVLDGCDAVMLSGETAKGLYPAVTVQTMSRICRTAEYAVDYRKATEAMRHITVASSSSAATPQQGFSCGPRPSCEALVVSAVVASFEEQSPLIIVLSETGISAAIAAKYRPEAAILCATPSQRVARRMQLVHGILATALPAGMDKQDAISAAMRKSVALGLVDAGDRVVVIHSSGSVMRIAEVPEWIAKDTQTQ